jgi:hypothetical protein
VRSRVPSRIENSSDAPIQCARTACSSIVDGVPSMTTPRCRNAAPRTENSAEKSSPVATPGSACTARIGSSVVTPRSSWSAADPAYICDGTPTAGGGDVSAVTVTVSLYVPVPSLSGMVRSTATGPASTSRRTNA